MYIIGVIVYVLFIWFIISIFVGGMLAIFEGWSRQNWYDFTFIKDWFDYTIIMTIVLPWIAIQLFIGCTCLIIYYMILAARKAYKLFTHALGYKT